MEYWDIYDAEKQPTGRKMKRNDWCLKDGEYHLTVLGVVARPDGTYLITKRVMTKAWAPGWWEVSGGAAQAGESSEEAVCREVREETGLDISNAEGGYVFTYKRENPGDGDNYFVDVYRFVLDIDENDLKLQKANEEKVAKEVYEAAQAFAKDLETKEIILTLKTGEGGRTFGSVSSKEISEAAKKQLNLDIDKKKLQLPEPIRTLGVTQVPVRLHPKVTGTLKVWVKEA